MFKTHPPWGGLAGGSMRAFVLPDRQDKSPRFNRGLICDSAAIPHGRSNMDIVYSASCCRPREGTGAVDRLLGTFVWK